MNRGRFAAALGLLAAAVAYELWRGSGHVREHGEPELQLDYAAEHGADAGLGNMLGVQPYVVPSDYVTWQSLYCKLSAYLAEARERGWLNPKSVVVFPEHIGTWLVAADEKRQVYSAVTVSRAAAWIMAANLPRTLGWWLRSPACDRLRYSLFRSKGAAMARGYHNVFSRLASRFGVTVVGGSVVLPRPRVLAGRVVCTDGPLHNVTALCGPDGMPYPNLVRKIHPTPDEQPFTASGELQDLTVFHTPAGCLGVLICADSWHPEPYEILRREGVDLVAVPSYLIPTGAWDRPWPGDVVSRASPHGGTDAPSTSLSEGEAWLRYALPGRIASSGARVGINVFLHGSLWDLGADGHTIVVRDGQVFEAEHVHGASLLNVWL
ncbi:MAG: carbon-nitrogen hydrolase family protein [Anaerolineae bacterium]|nr:carbon-nitrogen hydrolase family protein [Anaerolineae bacterium]